MSRTTIKQASLSFDCTLQQIICQRVGIGGKDNAKLYGYWRLAVTMQTPKSSCKQKLAGHTYESASLIDFGVYSAFWYRFLLRGPTNQVISFVTLRPNLQCP